MPRKVMKPLGANYIGQSASFERGNAPKTMSKLFLEAVKLHGRKVTEKNIYDYFETKNIRLKDHLLNMPVMTRSGAVYQVDQSQRYKLRKQALDQKEKPRKPGKKMKVDNKNHASESSGINSRDKKSAQELKIKSEISSAEQNNVAQPDSSENIESRNRPQTIISDTHGKIKKAIKRKMKDENYCEESAVQSIPGEKRTPQLKGKAKRSRTKQKDVVQIQSVMGVNKRIGNPQTNTSDPQVKLKKSVKRRKIDNDNYDEKSVPQSFADEKCFPKSSKGITKRSTAKQADVAQPHSSENSEKCFNNPQAIISDPQGKTKKVSARKGKDTYYGKIEAGGQAIKRKATDSENECNAIQICSNNPKSSLKRRKNIEEIRS